MLCAVTVSTTLSSIGFASSHAWNKLAAAEDSGYGRTFTLQRRYHQSKFDQFTIASRCTVEFLV